MHRRQERKGSEDCIRTCKERRRKWMEKDETLSLNSPCWKEKYKENVRRKKKATNFRNGEEKNFFSAIFFCLFFWCLFLFFILLLLFAFSCEVTIAGFFFSFFFMKFLFFFLVLFCFLFGLWRERVILLFVHYASPIATATAQLILLYILPFLFFVLSFFTVWIYRI